MWERIDRYIAAIWERTKTPAGLITVVVLFLCAVGVLWLFRIDVAALLSGWMGQ